MHDADVTAGLAKAGRPRYVLLAMPWEAKRWVLFAVLMAIMSLYALTYRPSGASQRSEQGSGAQASGNAEPVAPPTTETQAPHTTANTGDDAGQH